MTSICGAKAKSTGKPCQLYPCKNGRCFLHGGKSTGPKTEEGRRRCAEVNITHGLRTKEAISEKRKIKELINRCNDLLESFI